MKFGWNRRSMTFGWAIIGGGYNCTAKQIANNWKSQMTSFGYTIGSTKCLLEYLNPLTDSSKASCDSMKWKIAMQKLGYVVGDTTCLTSYLKNQITGS